MPLYADSLISRALRVGISPSRRNMAVMPIKRSWLQRIHYGCSTNTGTQRATLLKLIYSFRAYLFAFSALVEGISSTAQCITAGCRKSTFKCKWSFISWILHLSLMLLLLTLCWSQQYTVYDMFVHAHRKGGGTINVISSSGDSTEVL